jgi:5-methylcytosine-specific restriction endonuclease McrA
MNMPLVGLAKREYARVWKAKRRDSFFSGKKCEMCGISENLELHHIDPSKKIASVIWSWAKARRDLEISKCMVLCKTCHTKYHSELAQNRDHGVTKYRYGCRCKICRDAQTARMIVYRARKRAVDGK